MKLARHHSVDYPNYGLGRHPCRCCHIRTRWFLLSSQSCKICGRDNPREHHFFGWTRVKDSRKHGSGAECLHTEAEKAKGIFLTHLSVSGKNIEPHGRFSGFSFFDVRWLRCRAYVRCLSYSGAVFDRLLAGPAVGLILTLKSFGTLD